MIHDDRGRGIVRNRYDTQPINVPCLVVDADLQPYTNKEKRRLARENKLSFSLPFLHVRVHAHERQHDGRDLSNIGRPRLQSLIHVHEAGRRGFHLSFYLLFFLLLHIILSSITNIASSSQDNASISISGNHSRGPMLGTVLQEMLQAKDESRALSYIVSTQSGIISKAATHVFLDSVNLVVYASKVKPSRRSKYIEVYQVFGGCTQPSISCAL